MRRKPAEIQSHCRIAMYYYFKKCNHIFHVLRPHLAANHLRAIFGRAFTFVENMGNLKKVKQAA